ncbi:hypothetical protein J4731_03560 [Providencia rettgeri]|nr:hypothetical protein [Providencia rettgeri]
MSIALTRINELAPRVKLTNDKLQLEQKIVSLEHERQQLIAGNPAHYVVQQSTLQLTIINQSISVKRSNNSLN